jgi:hypothetical protein
MPLRRPSGSRVAVAALAVSLVLAIATVAALEVPGAGVANPSARGSGASGTTTAYRPVTSLPASPGATEPGTYFQPIGIFATPAPPSHAHPGFQSTDKPLARSTARPGISQAPNWSMAKAYGRVAVVGGKVVTLGHGVDPLLMAGTSVPVPQARTLDTAWSRWIVEPLGLGPDEKGTPYRNLSFWNLCGPGASTVALYYWQQLIGHPNVTGTEGWFLDPYEAQGAPWPSLGPTVAIGADGTRVGTYWSGSDNVNGYTAHGRGFLMYMATQVRPPTWFASGISTWVDGAGQPLYPQVGSSREDIMAGVNWEISGHDPNTWMEAWYQAVDNDDGALDRDLQVAVALDVGRDGVPVVAAVDTFDLPNWQAGSATPHIRHAISIVGYDNTANPPTYTYLDSCGRACNARGSNRDGGIYVVAQSQMIAAMRDEVGVGFIW